jgi:hypothetical protein
MSFQIGWPHWWVIPLAVLSAFNLLKNKNKQLGFLILGLVVLGLAAAFLAHPRSTPIWANITILQFVQFPWRFLGLVIFMFSFAAGAIALFDKWLASSTLTATIILATLVLNFSYFKPGMYFWEDTDETKLSGEQFIIQQKSAILDYLPKTSKRAPESKAPDKPWLEIVLPPGKHMVHGRFENTSVRLAANAISIASALILAVGAVLTLNKKKFLGIR